VAQQWDANDRRAPGHAPDLQSIAAWLLLIAAIVGVSIMLAVFRALDTTAAVVGSVYRYGLLHTRIGGTRRPRSDM
jgi:hypothetical protein